MFERMLDKTNVPTKMQLYAYCKDVGVYFEEINALLMKEGHTPHPYVFLMEKRMDGVYVIEKEKSSYVISLRK